MYSSMVALLIPASTMIVRVGIILVKRKSPTNDDTALPGLVVGAPAALLFLRLLVFYRGT